MKEFLSFEGSLGCLSVHHMVTLNFATVGYLEKKKQALPKGKNNVPHSGGFRVRNLMVELADFKKI